ncbi:MAG TPA: transglycosylase family protein [Candidatus Limnocylindria bacterium]|nr:transglycosylase family protein [Candidatus Limnocylindria bacterium]
MTVRRVPLVVSGVLACVALLAPVAPSAAFSPSGPGGAVSAPSPIAQATSASSIDRTVTTKARTSASYRRTIARAEFVASAKAKYVVKRESGGNCRAVSSSGAYRGKWQMGSSFWAGYGGKAFASRPDLATCAEQDIVAYRGWLASWWHPWGG